VSRECSTGLADSIHVGGQQSYTSCGLCGSSYSSSGKAEDGLPYCSTRVAAHGRRRVNKPEVQAHNLLMRKWRVTGADSSPDADAIVAYNEAFRAPLCSTQRRAIYSGAFHSVPVTRSGARGAAYVDG
jgi:hypothetical protein